MKSSWSYLKETQKYRKKLEDEKLRVVKLISLNCGLLYGDLKWEIEYPKYLGYLQSLDFSIKQLDEVKDEGY